MNPQNSLYDTYQITRYVNNVWLKCVKKYMALRVHEDDYGMRFATGSTKRKDTGDFRELFSYGIYHNTHAFYGEIGILNVIDRENVIYIV